MSWSRGRSAASSCCAPIARGPSPLAAVELHQPAPRRLVARIGRALALEQRDLLHARRAARRREQAVAGLDVARRDPRQHLPVLDRAIPCPSESYAWASQRRPSGIVGPPPHEGLQHRHRLVLPVEASRDGGQLAHDRGIRRAERHQLAEHRDLALVVALPQVGGEQALEQRHVVRPRIHGEPLDHRRRGGGVLVRLVRVGQLHQQVAPPRQAPRRVLERRDLPVRLAERLVGGGQPQPELRVGGLAAQRLGEHVPGQRVLPVGQVGPAQVAAPRDGQREEREGEQHPQPELPALDLHPSRTSTSAASPARTVRCPSRPVRGRSRRDPAPSRISTAISRSAGSPASSTTFGPMPESRQRDARGLAAPRGDPVARLHEVRRLGRAVAEHDQGRLGPGQVHVERALVMDVAEDSLRARQVHRRRACRRSAPCAGRRGPRRASPPRRARCGRSGSPPRSPGTRW